MDRNTHLEALSTEIFFEIFDYLHALDIFRAFSSLNRRISSILQIIPLRVVISRNHRRYHVDYLSSHLTSHAHQVISMGIFDTIDDDSSIVNLLFSQHKFINLQSCTFISIHPSTKLENVIEQIQSFNRLVLFNIRHPKNDQLNENAKKNLLETIFMHKSPSLRSIELDLPYDYLNISKYISIPSNLKSLYLHISSSTSEVFVDSIIPIFRFCHSIKYLSIMLSCSLLINNNNITNEGIPVNDENLPVLSEMMLFDLTIIGYCDGRAVYYILQCVPNLRYFYFTLVTTNSNHALPGELLDGSVWKQMLEHYVPCLLKFEFDMFIATQTFGLSLGMIVNSFVCCARKYSNWHMIIDRWKSNTHVNGECLMLRTLNYDKHESPGIICVPGITTQSFETLSTTKTDGHHLFYPRVDELSICIAKKRATITWSSPLYQHVQHLTIEISFCSSIWNSLLNIEINLIYLLFTIFVSVSVNKIDDDDIDDPQKIVPCLSQFVYLPNVIRVEFGSTFDISCWREIQLILQACPNVIELILDTRLLCVSKLIDNFSLISSFKQVKMLILETKKIYFPPKLSSKIVERFPSLNQVELHMFSFDHCVPVIDVFISHLKQLSYIKIHYFQDTLLDDPFSIDYILRKRSEIFPDVHLNAERIKVKNDGEVIQIWLS